MFTFPDFINHPLMIDLFKKMGIDSDYVSMIPLDYKLMKKINPDSNAIFNSIQYDYFKKINNGIDETFNIGDIKVYGKANLLTIKENPIILYIKHDYKEYAEFESQHRYHLAMCGTIRVMKAKGRKDRYVITNRRDGLFYVNINGPNPREELKPLPLCKRCIKILKRYHMYKEPFSIDEFFRNHHIPIPDIFDREETQRPGRKYLPNQKQWADHLKKQCHYICSECGVDCSSHPECLHLHHKSGIRDDYSQDNLKVLCVICHSEQDFHSHTKKTWISQKEIVKDLRKQQGINPNFSINMNSKS